MNSTTPQSVPLASPPPAKKDWPHAPAHRLSLNGTYMVTAGTYLKEHFFRGEDRLDHLEGMLLSLARHYHWEIEAWAVFSNHYHFVAHSPPDGTDATSLRTFLSRLHTQSAIEVNKQDGTPGRKVWYNFWDSRLEPIRIARSAAVLSRSGFATKKANERIGTRFCHHALRVRRPALRGYSDRRLTYEESCLARLHCVHGNPVRHKLVPVANQYPWCSAAWFERTASPAMVQTIYSFKIDKVEALDDF